MQHQEKIEFFIEKNGFVTAQWCKKNNIPTVYLSRMAKKGAIERAARGFYVPAGEMRDDFLIFQHRFPKSVFSYETALFLLGMTEKLIVDFDVTVESHYKFNVPPQNARLHYVKKELLFLGATEAKTPYGNIVKIYSPERVVCDFIKNKDFQESEVYIKTLKTYSALKNKDMHLLQEVAAKMNITEKVRSALEVLL